MPEIAGWQGAGSRQLPLRGSELGLTWSDPLLRTLPGVTAVHSRPAAQTERWRREEEAAALFSLDGGGGTV